ncbi:MAG: VCBS repeat-containing protein [Desulfobulbaceae bacterium]|nr:VCBS repeat-containing protein [Desulfobulbaceae bacterium]
MKNYFLGETMRIFLGLMTFVVIWVSGIAYAANNDTKGTFEIVFSTFESRSSGEYSYLADSIQAMLVSRLSAKDRVRVIDRVLTQVELKQLKKGKDFSSLQVGDEAADYIVTGSLFAVVSGLNVQVSLYPLDISKEILNFSILSESNEEIIPDMEDLSNEIAERAFGYSAERVATDASGTKGFTTEHPEAAYKKGLYTGTVVGTGISGIETRAIGVKRKLSLDGEVISLAVGDVDGDGFDEVFTLAGSHLGVYRVNGRQISKIDGTDLSRKLRIHALNLADINKDGMQEIYLSATDGLSVASLIMEWSKAKGFSLLNQNIPMYLRPIYIPKQGMRLAGQYRGQEKLKLVQPGVQLLSFDGSNRPKSEGNLPIPRSVNLFDFTYADLDGDSFAELVVIDQNDHLKVYSPSNELMWVSEKNFGGSKRYLGPSQGEAVNEQDRRNFTTSEDAERELIFVPGRIFATDINGDGKNEIVVNESKMSNLGFFKRLRPYTSGTVVGLVWNEQQLIETWRTGIYRGYLVDFSFSLDSGIQAGDSTTTTGKESKGVLFVINIPSSGSFASLLPGSSDTELSVYELGFSQTKQNDE